MFAAAGDLAAQGIDHIGGAQVELVEQEGVLADYLEVVGAEGLWRAVALALADPRRQRCAEQALAGCVADERQLARLDDASLCHGWAGLIQTTWRVAADAGDPEMFPMPHLARRMEQNLHRRRPPVHDGLLEGTAGIRLVRHTTAATDPPASGWDACLLLDGGRI